MLSLMYNLRVKFGRRDVPVPVYSQIQFQFQFWRGKGARITPQDTAACG